MQKEGEGRLKLKEKERKLGVSAEEGKRKIAEI